MMNFNKWIDTFVFEKGIDLEEGFEVEGACGTNYMQYGNVIVAIKSTLANEQKKIKSMLIIIDFQNGDVKHYLRHLAKEIAL